VFRIIEIQLQNFGPYKGSQSIVLPRDPGVTIIYGENMRGKTSLLNAIRYALFGTILSRGSRNVAPKEIVNWESQEEGNYSFSVTLVFESGDSNYELTRQYRPKKSVDEPRTEDDYTEEVFLKKDGSIMGPDDQTQQISRVLPEQVSRFFLFDGELLQQYEELLIEESDMGRQIREAIERILGVPILKNGRADLVKLLEDAESQVSKAAQNSQLTSELGTQLETTQEQKRHLEKDLNKLIKDKETLEDDKIGIKAELDKIEATRSKIKEIEILEEQVEEIDSKIYTKNEELKDLMGHAWHVVLMDKINERRSILEQQEADIQDQRIEKSVAKKLAERFSEAISDETCPICRQEIDSEHKSHLDSEIDNINGMIKSDGGEFSNNLRYVTRAIEGLRSMEQSNPKMRISDKIFEIDTLKAEKATKEDRIREVKADIDTSEESRAARLIRENESTIGKISVKKEAIQEQREKVRIVKENIENLREQLNKVSGDELEDEKERSQLYQDLVRLFDKGVEKYRDELRDHVEQDASDIFVQLTTEPEYHELEINDNYGLSIVHESGDKITIRSSGAEHVVALALMGALQNNAPLKGPIIMDSPFGRLDEGHVRNIIETLPNLTENIVLLLHENELDIEDARNILKGKLKKEYSLQRVTARHTKLIAGGVTDV